MYQITTAGGRTGSARPAAPGAMRSHGPTRNHGAAHGRAPRPGRTGCVRAAAETGCFRGGHPPETGMESLTVPAASPSSGP